MFRVGWLLTARYFDRGRKSLPFFAGLALILSPRPITESSMQAFAITTFPLVRALWLLDPRFPALFFGRNVAGLLCLWLLVPWLWTWGGMPQLGAFSYDLAYISHEPTGKPFVGDNHRPWPFRTS